MKYRMPWIIAIAATLGLSLCAGQYLRFRWCHANAFAGEAHADWRTAFLGDSLTQLFQYPATNYGFIGATSGDLRGILQNNIRCRCYRRIVILAGTNDVLETVPEQQTVANLAAMVAQAQSKGLEVYLGTVPPVFGVHADRNAAIDALNLQIAALSARSGATLLDYNRALAGHSEYAWDGVHLTKDGYAAMMRVLVIADLVQGHGTPHARH